VDYTTGCAVALIPRLVSVVREREGESAVRSVLREYGVLFALALIWGASFLFIKVAVEEVSPATVVAGRLTASVITLGVIVALRPRLVTGWYKYWRLGIITGVFNIIIPFLLISWGETRITSGTASILNATVPLFIVLFANWWIGPGHETLTVGRVLSMLVGFVGVAVTIGPSALDVVGHGTTGLIGELAILIAAASYGIGGLLSRRFTGSAQLVGPISTQVPALILSLLIAFVWSPPTHLPSLKVIGAIATLGALGTGIAYLLYFWLIYHVGPTRTSLVTYLLPCTALIWGALLLNEQITWNAIAGLALVLLGTMLTNGTFSLLFRRKKQRPIESADHDSTIEAGAFKPVAD
jgi:drug/metabolite transporter (DMT)-like permease